MGTCGEDSGVKVTIRTRDDGWPLCPACGQDELYSLLHWNGQGPKPPLEKWLAAGMRCYACGWYTGDMQAVIKMARAIVLWAEYGRGLVGWRVIA